MYLDNIQSIAISSDNSFIVVGYSQSAIKVYCLKTQKEIHHYDKLHIGNIILSFQSTHVLLGGINALELSKDDRFLVSTCRKARLSFFDLQEKKQLYNWKILGNIDILALTPLTYLLDEAHSIAVSSDCRFIGYTGGQGQVKIMNIQPEEQLSSLRLQYKKGELQPIFSPDSYISEVSVSEDGKYIVCKFYHHVFRKDSCVKVFDRNTGKELYCFPNVCYCNSFLI